MASPSLYPFLSLISTSLSKAFDPKQRQFHYKFLFIMIFLLTPCTFPHVWSLRFDWTAFTYIAFLLLVRFWLPLWLLVCPRQFSWPWSCPSPSCTTSPSVSTWPLPGSWCVWNPYPGHQSTRISAKLSPEHRLFVPTMWEIGMYLDII